MSAGDAVSPQQFFHATDAHLNPGDVIKPGHKPPGTGGHSDDFDELGHHNFTWMFPNRDHVRSYGRHTYQVEPIGLHHPYSFDLARTGDASMRTSELAEDRPHAVVALGGARVIKKITAPNIGDTK